MLLFHEQLKMWCGSTSLHILDSFLMPHRTLGFNVCSGALASLTGTTLSSSASSSSLSAWVSASTILLAALSCLRVHRRYHFRYLAFTLTLIPCYSSYMSDVALGGSIIQYKFSICMTCRHDGFLIQLPSRFIKYPVF